MTNFGSVHTEQKLGVQGAAVVSTATLLAHGLHIAG